MDSENSAGDTFDETWARSSDDVMTGAQTLSSSTPASNSDQGPCLYLGPNGQRCDRRALAGGYCARHRPGAITLPKVSLSKKTLAAIAAGAGILWPYIGEVVREIIRWMHSH